MRDNKSKGRMIWKSLQRRLRETKAVSSGTAKIELTELIERLENTSSDCWTVDIEVDDQEIDAESDLFSISIITW